MPSLDGLTTWLDYEIRLVALVVVLVAVVLASRRLLTYLRRLPLGSPDFALSVVGVCFGVVLLLLGVAARLR